MSIKKINLELGPAHVIARMEFTPQAGGGEATVVGVECDGAMTWSTDAPEESLAQVAEKLASDLFDATLTSIMGPSDEPAGGGEGSAVDGHQE